MKHTKTIVTTQNTITDVLCQFDDILTNNCEVGSYIVFLVVVISVQHTIKGDPLTWSFNVRAWDCDQHLVCVF